MDGETTYPNGIIGPTTPSDAPIRFTRTVILPAAPETVFGVVSGQAHLCELVPGLQQVHMDLDRAGGVEGVGMVRSCDFGNDMWIRETVVLWQPPHAFAYSIAAPNPFGLIDHLATVTCQPVQAATRLTWQQHYHHADLNAMNVLMASLMDGLVVNLNRRFQISSHKEKSNDKANP